MVEKQIPWRIEIEFVCCIFLSRSEVLVKPVQPVVLPRYYVFLFSDSDIQGLKTVFSSVDVHIDLEMEEMVMDVTQTVWKYFKTRTDYPQVPRTNSIRCIHSERPQPRYLPAGGRCNQGCSHSSKRSPLI